MRKFLLIIAIAYLYGCNNSGEEHASNAVDTTSYFNPKWLVTDSGLLRNINISANIKEVKLSEQESPIDEQEGYLYYEYPLSKNNKYTLTYSFDDKGLYEIQSDIFINDTNTITTEFRNLQAAMENKFGAPIEKHSNISIWLLNTDESDEVEIVLKNATSEQKTGTIAISVYDYDYHR